MGETRVGPGKVASRLLPWLGAVLVAIGCSSGSGGEGEAAPVPDGGEPAPCEGVIPVAGDGPLTLVGVASGLDRPVQAAAPPGDRARIFVAEQGGRVVVVRDGQVLERPFLDLAGRVSTSAGAGFLGFAFHPDYERNGRFFVHFAREPAEVVVAEYRVGVDPDVADPASERTVLLAPRVQLGHDGGQLAFGPDGYLYVGLGDGGPEGDPFGKAQDVGDLNGSVLRIDVDGTDPVAGTAYRVPPSNPLVGVGGARPEIWLRGLRQPWRFSFDLATGDLYLGDVGQDEREEIDVLPAPSSGGENLGWNRMEGTRCFEPAEGCDPDGLTPPVLDYEIGGPDGSCAVVGGYVYRGCALPDLRGTYFYGDFCAGFVRSFRWSGGRVTDPRDHTTELAASGLRSVVSFGEDARGELLVVDHRGGRVFRLEPAASAP